MLLIALKKGDVGKKGTPQCYELVGVGGVEKEIWLPCPRLREKACHSWLVIERKLVFSIFHLHRPSKKKAAEHSELSLNPLSAPFQLCSRRQVV